MENQLLPKSMMQVTMRPTSPEPPVAIPTTYTPQYRQLEIKKAEPTEAPVAPKKFSLDFGKTQIIRDDDLYKNNFRYKAEENLRGTLKSYADRKVVADLLWNKRGGGLRKDEVKYGLRSLEKSGKLRPDQVRAVRKKYGVY